MAAPRSISRVARIRRAASVFAGLWLAGAWLGWSEPAAADSVLAGTVTDAVTGQPVAGAEVGVEYSGAALGSGTSDIDGVYRVPFTVPPAAPSPATMTAAARSPGHEVNRTNFQVTGGAPLAGAHDIALYPLGITACRSQTRHSVIVGHFLPPPQESFPDLPMRVARSLDFALNTRLQAARLAIELQPSFEPCEAAAPRSPRLGANFAKALRADAFVGGEVTDAPSRFTVTTYVSDAYDVFPSPAVTTSRSVDLGNPSGAAIAGETYTAVLAAIAAGLARQDDCVSAIAVIAVAEQMASDVPPFLATLRRQCESRLPNGGLLGPSP